ncbi:Uncharacterised protein [Mycobacterium tuberculosis]|nr:Uncharacterised protein [Mycobacterium tuberculosis]
MSSRESCGGISTVTSPAWLPWLLWIVIACMVWISARRLVAKLSSPPAPAMTARKPSGPATTTPVSPL